MPARTAPTTTDASPTRPQRRRAALLAPLAALALLAGCGSSDSSGSAGSSADSTPPETTAATPAALDSPAADGPVSAVDPQGETVTLDAPPQRIVCLTGLCDDVLFTLGITPVGTSTPGLLELPEYLGDAAESQVATIPGGFGTEDLESIAALEPDLVVGLAGVHDENRSAIEQFAPLVVVDVTGYEDSLAYQTFFGELTGRTAQAEAGNEAFRGALADAEQQSSEAGLSDMTALSMYWNVGTMGVNTADDILGSIFSQIFDYPWPNKGGDYTEQAAYSLEEILAADPEVIFMQSYTATPTSPKASEELASNPVWSRVAAVREGHVLEVPVDLWTAGRGPKALTLVIQQAVDFALG